MKKLLHVGHRAIGKNVRDALLWCLQGGEWH